MALTNTRPVQIPTVENDAIHNSTSPVFQASSLGRSRTPKIALQNELVDGSDSSQSPGSGVASSDSESYSPKAKKATNDATKKKDSMSKSQGTFTPTAVASLPISKTIPVTGERPMPENSHPPLDDEVLHAIFIILWEKDPGEKGMTVKQLCDFLLERHPEMSNLSTKLSNLISAKLNAYVKKVEKGEKTLTYALSREWADASPRRMVYVYRGILAPDYKQHARAASQQDGRPKPQKSNSSTQRSSPKKPNESTNANANPLSSPESTLVDSKNAGSFTRSLGVSNMFAIGSYGNDFNIPYASSPVSAGLTPKVSIPATNAPANNSASDADGVTEDTELKGIKRSKSTTALNPNNKKMKIQPNPTYITAAAAAPRLSKLTVRNGATNSPRAAAAVAAIHKAVAAQTPIEAVVATSNYLTAGSSSKNFFSPELICKTWLKTVRNGFLAEDIDSPETLSVDDLDNMFD